MPRRSPIFRLVPESAVNRTSLLFASVVIAAAACGKAEVKPVTIQTATVQRRDIRVDVTATGVIEPINVVEVKSRSASGQIIKMPVEIGTRVRPGDLIVQLDTRDVQNQFEQADADLKATKANFDVQTNVLKRQTDLFNQKIITQNELETAQISFANAQSSLVRSQTNVDLAKQKLEDATVKAAVEGTIITKPVSVGQVIQAGASSVGGGSIIATMADLTKVRSRALVNETDIGQVQLGQSVNVTVDAFPNQQFTGVVEKIEPQAVVQQSVTMFPVLISLSNEEGLLRPGMNGEVNILTDMRTDVIAVPNDAIRSTREARQAAALLNLNPDSVQAMLRPAGGFGGPGGGANSGMSGSGGAGRGGAGGATTTSRGEIDELFFQGGQGGDRQGGGQGGGRGFGGPPVEVTDADCKAIDAAWKKKPAAKKKLDDLRAQMMNGGDRRALSEQMRPLYEEAGVDMRKAGACTRRNGGGQGGPNSGAASGMSGSRGGNSGFSASNGGGQGGFGGTSGSGGRGARGQGGRPRTGLVFVQKGTTWEPKVIRLGVANYDYTEVTDDKLKEGDKVAMLSAAALQAKRQEQNDKMKAMNGSPLGGSPAGGAGGGGARPAGGGRGN